MPQCCDETPSRSSSSAGQDRNQPVTRSPPCVLVGANLTPTATSLSSSECLTGNEWLRPRVRSISAPSLQRHGMQLLIRLIVWLRV